MILIYGKWIKFDIINYDAVWREFVWGGIAGAFGEGMMHPVDTLKTRLQSQAILAEHQVDDLVMSKILQLM